MAEEGKIIAVEYNKADRETMEDNVQHFGLQNVIVIDHVDENSMKDCPQPSLVFMVASASMEQELACLTKLNPQIRVVIYTLDFHVAANAADTLEKYGITDVETIQISVSRLSSSHSFKQEPAPWIIVGKA
jgi:precorrin-6Y C5,15-methyltransferase (decarboxylating)